MYRVVIIVALSCFFLLIWLFRYCLKRVRSARINALTGDLGRSHTPENTIIVFDIHGVLFKPDYVQIINAFLRSPYKYRCMRYALYPSTWADYSQLVHEQLIMERFFAYFIDKYPELQPCLSLLVTIANAQKPIDSIIALAEQLYRAGYTLHIISNIGEPLGKDLQRKFPGIFKYFSVIKTPTLKNKFKKKSHVLFFQEYLQEHNHLGKQVILIDDNEQNIQIARKVGIHGIFFLNERQLKKELAYAGVL